jgi:hypothetical protein
MSYGERFEGEKFGRRLLAFWYGQMDAATMIAKASDEDLAALYAATETCKPKMRVAGAEVLAWGKKHRL